MITTFFDIDWKLFGQESLPYSQCGWEEVEPGRHEYPFALKVNRVNSSFNICLFFSIVS
jgi:hypothetical protein